MFLQIKTNGGVMDYQLIAVLLQEKRFLLLQISKLGEEIAEKFRENRDNERRKEWND